MPLVHFAINLLLMALLAGLGTLVCTRGKKAALAGALAGGAMYFVQMKANARPDLFAAAVPFSWAVFYWNMFPYAAAFAIPCLFAFAESRAQVVRMALLSAVLFALSFGNSKHFFQPMPAIYQPILDENGIVRQSSADSCSAAAAATLLRRHGIEADERTAATLALTRKGIGTLQLGVYRALWLLAGPKGYRVEFRHIAADDLVALGRESVATVGLPKVLSPREKEFAYKYSWGAGVMHDVVVVGPDPKRPGHVLIADPSMGLESWPMDHFRALHRGFGIWLEPAGAK